MLFIEDIETSRLKIRSWRKAASPSREKWPISILRQLRFFANLDSQRTEKRAIKNGDII